jgi:hypothetical protein
MENCCQRAHDENTLITQPKDPDRPDITIYTCPECDRRHIVLEVDPLEIGLVFPEVG